MTPTKDIHDIIRTIIARMDNNICIEEVIVNPDNTITAKCCYTAWLMQEDILLGQFRVINVIPNKEVTVEVIVPGSVLQVGQPLSIPRPTYFHGTVRNTNAELLKIKDGTQKYPMIYCLEVFNEVFTGDPELSKERDSSLRLFFLGSNNYKDWITEDHYQKVIIPLRNMVDSFVSYVNNGEGFAELEPYTTVNHVNFGTFAADNGNLKWLLDGNISGIELDITLPILKSLTCEGDCSC